MTSAGAVLDVARSQIGYVEEPGTRTKYGAAYGMDGYAWCAMFQWWCFREAGALPLIPKTAYTPTFYSWFQQRGQASRTPQVGDLVFYNFPDSLDRIQHVGIVEAVHADGTITTIEGNTTSGIGSQDRGGGVWRRRRSTGSVVGYGRPAYSRTAAAPPVLATLTYGMRNDSRVMALQRWLNAYPWKPELPLLPVTGNYLNETKRVVAGAQKQTGVTGSDADGSIVGPRTQAAFVKRGARW